MESRESRDVGQVQNLFDQGDIRTRSVTAVVVLHWLIVVVVYDPDVNYYGHSGKN